jgi:hypothetical protein
MRVGTLFVISVVLAAVAAPAFEQKGPAAADAVAVSAKWNTVERVSNTIPTTQHLANAFTLRSNPLNKTLLKDLRDLHTNDTRLQLWYSVPNQVVAELKEPTSTETFWNFKYMDPVVIDYFANTSDRHHVNIGTIPRWMFNVPPAEIPADPAATFYGYIQGTKGDLLKDPTGKQFADYQARLYEWYSRGGFTDEIGKYHKSGYHFKIDYWGILNEPDFENELTVEQYTRIWDAVAEKIHMIDPKVQFFGPEVSGAEVAWARYFLNPRNHSPSAPPVQWFTVHNYVSSNNDPATWQAKFFTNTTASDGFSARVFVDQLHEVMKIRDDLSPKTRIAIDELGTFIKLKSGDTGGPDDEQYSAYNPLYWVAMGGNWADNFITAEREGVPLISMTQMVGAPTQSPSCSMINPNTVHPNAHYWVLSMVNSNFGPGDKLVASESSSPDVVAQASITAKGRKALLVNTSDHAVTVNLSGAFASGSLNVEVVDEVSAENPPRREQAKNREVNLAPFAVVVVSQGIK